MMQVVVPHRAHDEDNTRHLKLMGDLGMINAIPFHARDPDSIAAAVEKSDVVINLLGKYCFVYRRSLGLPFSISVTRRWWQWHGGGNDCASLCEQGPVSGC
jgi:hypothetical protein